MACAHSEIKRYPLTGTGYRVVQGIIESYSIPESRERVGKMLELATAHSLDEMEDTPYVKNAVNGLGADFTVKGSILIEAKNFNGEYDITPFIFKSTILDRFTSSDPDHTKEWILLISKLKCAQEVMSLLNQHHISIVQVGQQVLKQSGQDIQKIERQLRKQLARVFSILIIRASCRCSSRSIDCDSVFLHSSENKENDGILLIMPFLQPIFVDLQADELSDFFDLDAE